MGSENTRANGVGFGQAVGEHDENFICVNI